MYVMGNGKNTNVTTMMSTIASVNMVMKLERIKVIMVWIKLVCINSSSLFVIMINTPPLACIIITAVIAATITMITCSRTLISTCT